VNALWPSFVPVDAQGLDELCAVSAHGVRVRFADGRVLLDGTSGLWNTNLGYGNDAVAQAQAEALRDASYLSTFRFENVYARRAAEALVEAAGPERYARVLFSTSGGAANDLVMKLARHFHVLGGAPRRQLVVGLEGSYHGLTYGSFSLTGQDLGQAVYGVDRRLVRHVPPNDVEALATLVDLQGDRLGAVVVEPVLGSGAVPLTPEFVNALGQARQTHGFLLVADEVATGFGRTGTLFASDAWPVAPDALVVSKGMTNGTCAASAVLVAPHVAARFHDTGAVLMHGETQAGTPVAAAAVLATLAEMDRLDVVRAGRRVAAELDSALTDLLRTHPRVDALTGTGCFRSVRLTAPDGAPLPDACVPGLVASIRDAGAIAHPGMNGVQLVPALTSTSADIVELVAAVREGLDAFLIRLEPGRVALAAAS